jgi:beta-glucosidase
MGRSIRRLKWVAIGAGLLVGLFQGRAEERPVYQDSSAQLERRVEDLLARLTPEEKLSLLSGKGFTTQPIPRLGVPPMVMVDAGQGVRGGDKGNNGPATAFPSGVAMASTWDVELVSRLGGAIGAEARNKGTGAQVLLGPAVNMQRSPLGGRNGEYFSEDPFLAARLGVGYIQGMQRTGVAACIKHFACNNEEVDRGFVDVRVGERALREIYLPAFEAGVKEGRVWTLMSSYNQVNGFHASANAYLLTDVLKKGWGFDGLVMSDWGGVHESAVAQAGNDLEMPGGRFATLEKIKAALLEGRLTQAAVEDSARRVLRAVIRVGLLDGPQKQDHAVVNCVEHQKLAFEAAAKGMVLLKNQHGLLPLERKNLRSIAVIGRPAKNLIVGALGSPAVKPFYTAQILDGIQAKAGTNVAVSYVPGTFAPPLPADCVTIPGGSEPGFKAQYFRGTKLEGSPILERVDRQIQFDTGRGPWAGVPATNFSARWTASFKAKESGDYGFAFLGDDGFRLRLNGEVVLDGWDGRDRYIGLPLRVARAQLQAGKTYPLEIEYYQRGGQAVARLDMLSPGAVAFADAARAAAQADVAVVCVSTACTEDETLDRRTMELPDAQAELIRSVSSVNRHTVVVLNNGGVVAMRDWVKQVPAVIETWYPGQEGGSALAAVLFGEINPSGKLPTTLAAERSDYPDYGNFPGKGDYSKKQSTEEYAEGIYIGYRHFDKHGITPLFPFGFGLSYTTFEYRHLALSQPKMAADGSVRVTVDIANTGKRAGEEVVELYVRDTRPRVDKPVRELKGFARVALRPGETRPVSFTLVARDFAYFDVAGKQWRADAGGYDIEVGASSRDIRRKTTMRLVDTYTEPVPLSKQFTP